MARSGGQFYVAGGFAGSDTALEVYSRQALARVLSGPSVNRYRIASTSQSGVDYLVTADGADVTCSCPGFEYRGQRRHARDVKAALAAGSAVPPAYVLDVAV